MKPQSDTKTERGLMEVLDASARHGKTCPRLHELSPLLGVSAGKVKASFDALRKAGKIAWETPYCGLGIGKVRVVRILATGQETARPLRGAWSGRSPHREPTGTRSSAPRPRCAGSGMSCSTPPSPTAPPARA